MPVHHSDPDFESSVRDAEDDIESAVSDSIQEARREIRQDPFLYGEADDSTYRNLLEADYDDAEEFRSEVSAARFTGDRAFVPNPDAEINIKLLEGPDQSKSNSDSGALIRIELENGTEIHEDDNHDEIDRALYEAQLVLRPTEISELNKIKFEELPDNFRYNVDVPGHGFNCAVEEEDEGPGIKTTTVPKHEQHLFQHRDLSEDGSDDATPSFTGLIENPVFILRNIQEKMESWGVDNWGGVVSETLDDDGIDLDILITDDYSGDYRGVEDFLEGVFDPENDGVLGDIPDDSSDRLETVQESLESYRDEIARFKQGIELLDDDEMARELFVQTNEVFWEKVQPNPGEEHDEPEYKSWRPFQIVYIVSNLPDIVAGDPSYENSPTGPDHNREEVSLIHIPTGGGKTEAYLALMVFAALFDRRRDKDFGVTGMMRFPLRLLSLQQFQRVTEILVYADEKRKEAGYGGDPFSAGYFSGATANKVEDLINTEFERYPGYPTGKRKFQQNKDHLNQFSLRWNSNDLERIDKREYQMVERCPLCGHDVETGFNPREARIEHRCTAPENICDRDRLNVHVLDQDIYRALPTMVLGTQDKLAAIGYEYRSRTLAGRVSHECPVHGYTHQNQCLMTNFCEVDGQGEVGNDSMDLEPVTPTRPAPGLTIQDELHLINEDLGTFESHYYAAFEKHLEWSCEDNGATYVRPKKIAATATIEEFENQIEHLYLQKGTLFPARGPKYRETVYTTQDKERTQRHYVGLVPWNRSQINSIMLLLEQYQRRIKDWINNPQDALNEFDFDDLDDPDGFVRLATHYYAMVTYVISRDEGGRVYKSTENQINENLTADGYEELERRRVTGGTDFRNISELLDKFEQLGEENGLTYKDIEELIVATSSISHGVDLNSLNWMLFFSAPPRMSEYIQASSRVGRKYPGIVVNMFDPIKERDRSHFHYFDKYHEYLDRLVEPVPLNRWAKFSVNRTFPGLLVSLFYIKYFEEIDNVLQFFGNSPDREDLARAINQGAINPDDCLEDLLEIYGEDPATNECPFADRVENLVRTSFAQIEGSDLQDAEDAIQGHKMNSLREVDEQIDITLKQDQRDILRKL